MNALLKARSADKLPEFTVVSLKRLDEDRRVAEIEVSGCVHLGSIYITGAKTTAPNVSWPKTLKGYPIITISGPLRSKIEEALLARLRKERK